MLSSYPVLNYNPSRFANHLTRYIQEKDDIISMYHWYRWTGSLHSTSVKVYTCSFMLIPAKGECNTSVLPKDNSPVTVVYYLISPFAPFNFYYSSFVGYTGNSFYPSHYASLYIIQIISDYHHSSSPPFILQWEDNVYLWLS
ncbi:uncharacterized protein LOC123987905 [Osmia bicornis bicornis]|uniref:uncharacterized protein LOC123987905 n=1 Tax=Osmia bicornis bicornis TaxID=1437191 RepID=UPI001EAEF404|nr:uncharacterized protein LOC123987905 [Osmia bicornis bicornis]